MTEIGRGLFQDSRTGKNGGTATGQFRQSVFGRLGGYDDVNDGPTVWVDPAMRWPCRRQGHRKTGRFTSQMGRFETELLATDENVEALVDRTGCGSTAFMTAIRRR